MEDEWVDQDLVARYGYPPAPTTRAELDALCGVPTFTNRPGKPGQVVMGQAWVNRNLVRVCLPILGVRYLNRIMVVALAAVLAEIEASPYYDYLKPAACGIYNPRRKLHNPEASLSTHAYALATDLNTDENPYGKIGKISKEPFLIECFEKRGFEWGGRWRKRDDMHFQRISSRIILPY